MTDIRELVTQFIIKTQEKRVQKELQATQLETVKQAYFPPLSSAVAIANAKIRFLKQMVLGICALSVILFFIEEHRINQAIKNVLHQNYLVLPVPNFMHARPGVIPDDVLFGFANWAVKQIEDFDYATVKSQYKDIETYMSPEMRVKFSFENEEKIHKYEKFQMRQYFSYGPPKSITQKTDAKGNGYFEVIFDGKLNRYTNDQILKPLSEKLVMRFGTSVLDKPNKSWMFEILDIHRALEKGDEEDEFSMPADLISTIKSALPQTNSPDEKTAPVQKKGLLQ